MRLKTLRVIMRQVFGVIFLSLGIVVTAFLVLAVFAAGYSQGYGLGGRDAVSKIASFIAEPTATPSPSSVAGETPVYNTPPAVVPPTSDWSGPDLWQAVNTRRVQLGVNSMSTRSELCTIASIRLNELLALGTLDAHAGFSNMPETRSDLAWIFEKYNLSEFLLAGATSAEHAVFLWENTLGHKKLLDGGEYVWGCIYAQNSFAVAIAAF